MDSIYRGSQNHQVQPAAPGEFEPLPLGPLRIWPPVVLAPMAGVTNHPFRSLCRRFGAGLYVSEMVTARPLLEGHEKTWAMASFSPEETIRSLQIYGIDPETVGAAVTRLVDEMRVDHLDMNFGCPVRKVTRRGGGAALPLKRRLFRNIVRAAVRAAGDVPVTVKFRMGINDQNLTYLDAGRIAEDEGCRAVGLHARTAAQLYDGDAQWDAITRLVEVVRTIPVLGNGDIFEAWDALRMMRQTGCAGVIVGRGCLGRPWLFRDLAEVFDGRGPPNPPRFGEVAAIMQEHARLLCDWLGEPLAMRTFRRHASWYTKGFRGSARVRAELMQVTTHAELNRILALLDPNEPFPPSAMRVSRGKSSGTQKVALPPGYLDDLEDPTPPPPEAEAIVSGG